MSDPDCIMPKGQWELYHNYPFHHFGGNGYIVAWYKRRGSPTFSKETFWKTYHIQRHD